MARIRIELLRKRFEMLAKDLGWRDGEWKGKPYISKEQHGWRVWKLTTPTGSGETDIARFTTSREMLAWIEGAECAVKAMTLAYEGEPGKSPASSATASWSADKQAELDYYKTKYSHEPKG